MSARKLVAPAVGAMTLCLAATVVGLAAEGRVASTDVAPVQVVTSSTVLADIVAEVAGPRARVRSLVPPGTDPATYEPTLRDLAAVSEADVAFANYPLQEGPAVTRALQTRLRPGARLVTMAEESIRFGADPMPRVVDRSLDAPWLGVSVRGSGADAPAEVMLAAVAHEGPGDLIAYLTGSFGSAEVFTDSRDGFEASDDYRDDTLVLAPGAHTHMTWAFTEPGVHRVTFRAQVRDRAGARARDLPEGVLTFAVGVDATRAGVPDAEVVDGGHADVAVDLAAGRLSLVRDAAPAGGPGAGHAGHEHGTSAGGRALDESVVVVPARARTEVPDASGYRFLGRPGDVVLQLPQAVLGAHVSGEIDPHLWHDVANARAYADLARSELVRADPAGSAGYEERAATYRARLERLDTRVREQLAGLPQARRHLVTQDARFGYLARAYGLDDADSLTPQPGTEPSLADRRRVAATVSGLDLPAVFVPSGPLGEVGPLARVADDLGVRTCALLDDVLEPGVRTYEQLVRTNTRTLLRCLGDQRRPTPSTLERP